MIESPEEFIELLNRDDVEARHRVRHDSASEDVWKRLIVAYPEVRALIPANKTVPPEILHVLATDPDEEVRWRVAMRRKLAIDTFELLARDSSSSVRACIASNKKAPLSVLLKLVEDELSVSTPARKQIDDRREERRHTE